MFLKSSPARIKNKTTGCRDVHSPKNDLTVKETDTVQNEQQHLK